jgi:predicted GNAT superfamily acetyltransferase
MSDIVHVRLARDRADYEKCVQLQRAVWGLADLEIASAIQMTTTVLIGGLVQIAETEAEGAVGFAYAVPGVREGSPFFHSDLLAVLPQHQKHGVGATLKWAQREEALRRGVSLITWNFDPLQASNAQLNLHRLGAVGVEFLPNVFGITSAALHHSLPTDRLAVRWELNSRHVVELSRGADVPHAVPMPDLPRVNEVEWRAGWPVSSEVRTDIDEPAVLLEIVPEWDVLSTAAPRLAEEWQGRVREAQQAYMGRGYRVTSFAPVEDEGRRRPFYVLRRS